MSATTLTATNFAVTLAEETKQDIQKLGTGAAGKEASIAVFDQGGDRMRARGRIVCSDHGESADGRYRDLPPIQPPKLIARLRRVTGSRLMNAPHCARLIEGVGAISYRHVLGSTAIPKRSG